MTVGIYKMTARDVMTRRADTIRDDDTIETAMETMVQAGLSALPVVTQAGSCVGMLTQTDIIRLAGQLEHEASHNRRHDLAALFFGVGLDQISQARVEDVMTTHVLSVAEDDPATAVADKMLQHEIHHLPVCDANDQIVGVVSSMDLVKAISRPEQV